MELARRVNEAYSDFLAYPIHRDLIRYGPGFANSGRHQNGAPRPKPAGGGSTGRQDQSSHRPTDHGRRKSIDRVERESTRPMKIIPGMFTSASLLAANGNVFYIFGAVNKPGSTLLGPRQCCKDYSCRRFAPSAETIPAHYRDEEDRAVGRIINQAEVISTGTASTRCKQADVVFVPDTQLSRQALMGDTIRRMIPVNLGVFYNFSHQVVPRP